LHFFFIPCIIFLHFFFICLYILEMGGWLSFLFVPQSKVFRLKNRKVIVRKTLGEGGFSFVYQVKDVHDNNIYALKKMLCQTEELLETGKREIQILERYKHANILGIVDHAIVPSRTIQGAQEVLMLLPFYKRGTLQDALDFQRKRFGLQTTTSPFTEKEVLAIFLGICNAVSVFHQSDPVLALRDLKPGNVLLSDKNEPILMDFGSVAPARVTVQNRQDALALQEIAEQFCTPQYRAPELFNIPSSCVLDERTDIWSLGCLLYALIFCRSPFEGATSVALAVQSPVTYPETNAFPLSLPLVRRMLTVDPHARPTIHDVISMIPAPDH